MSTYKSCWRWSDSQFSTCMNLLRHGCQRNSLYTFPDKWINSLSRCSWIPNSNQNFVYSGHRWGKGKDFFVFCSEKICLVLFQGVCSLVLSHLCPVHKINAQTPITTIFATRLSHEFILNVKYRMDWSCRKPYICLSFNLWKQYSANGTCLTSVNMQKYVTSLWLLWKSRIFSDSYWNSLTC